MSMFPSPSSWGTPGSQSVPSLPSSPIQTVRVRQRSHSQAKKTSFILRISLTIHTISRFIFTFKGYCKCEVDVDVFLQAHRVRYCFPSHVEAYNYTELVNIRPKYGFI